MINSNHISQLTLGVSLKDEATFGNFCEGSNDQLVAVLKMAAAGEGERVIYFYNGQGGNGRTHLLQAVCRAATHRAVYLPLTYSQEFSPTVLEGLEALDLICIDDIQAIAGKPQWEEAFFHAYNRVHDAGKRLIITADVPPKLLAVGLADVVSRLSAGVVYQLHPLRDEEKLRVLILSAERRGMHLSEETGRFMMTHYERHLGVLFDALLRLDKASLAAQRKLTIPFVKQILGV